MTYFTHDNGLTTGVGFPFTIAGYGTIGNEEDFNKFKKHIERILMETGEEQCTCDPHPERESELCDYCKAQKRCLEGVTDELPY